MDIGSRTVTASQRMRYHFSRLQTAPQLSAVLDCLFELAPCRTNPSIAELALVDDRLIFARLDGESSFRYFVGRREELVVNLVGFVKHLKLGNVEREYVLSRIDSIPRRRAA